MLTKLAIIPQKRMFSVATSGAEGSYSDGDFVVHFEDCWNPERDCEKAYEMFWRSRKSALPVSSATTRS